MDRLVEGGTPVGGYIAPGGQEDPNAAEKGKGAESPEKAKGKEGAPSPGGEPKVVPVTIGQKTWALHEAVAHEIATLRKNQGDRDSDIAKIGRTLEAALVGKKGEETKPASSKAGTTEPAPITQAEIDTFWEGVGTLDTELTQGSTSENVAGKFTSLMKSMTNLMARQFQERMDVRFGEVLEHIAEHESSMDPVMAQSRDLRDETTLREKIAEAGLTDKVDAGIAMKHLRQLQETEVGEGGDEFQIRDGWGRLVLIGQAIQNATVQDTGGGPGGTNLPPDENSQGSLDPAVAQVLLAKMLGVDATTLDGLRNGASKAPVGSVSLSRMGLSEASAKTARDKTPGGQVFGGRGQDKNQLAAKLVGVL